MVESAFSRSASNGMVYETYETEAFVLSARPTKEGDKFFALYTMDFGLIRASARNIRGETSKLRYNLQTLSRTHISLVRGREEWRIVGAKEAEHFFLWCARDSERLLLLRRIFDIVTRLVRGEGANEKLFFALKEFVRLLESADGTSKKMRSIELLSLARILQTLGYFAGDAKYEPLLVHSHTTPELLAAVIPLERDLIKDINEALHESQL